MHKQRKEKRELIIEGSLLFERFTFNLYALERKKFFGEIFCISFYEWFNGMKLISELNKQVWQTDCLIENEWINRLRMRTAITFIIPSIHLFIIQCFQFNMYSISLGKLPLIYIRLINVDTNFKSFRFFF